LTPTRIEDGEHMSDGGKLTLRVIAIVMALAAVTWGFEIWRQAHAADDGGPPLGAICMAVPSIALLIGAGAVWRRAHRRDDRPPAG
jgi:hypothetical protein